MSPFAAAYATYFASVGLLITYVPLHLEALGLSAAAIGSIFGARTILSTVSQLLVTRRLGVERVGRVLVACGAWAVLTGIVLAAAPDTLTVVVAILALALGQGLVIPLLDTVVVDRCGPERFGPIRRWGSVGYGLAVGAFAVWASGRAYASVGARAAVVVAVAFVAMAISLGLAAREAGKVSAPAPSTAAAPPTVTLALFFLYNALHWVPLAQFNVFVSLHVARLGLDAAVPGVAIAAMIVGEVAAMSVAERLRARFSAEAVLGFAMAIGVVRWGLTAVVTSAPALVVLQLLNFASFGLWLPLTFRLLRERFAGGAPVAAQGRFYALVFGVGGLVAAGSGGWIFDHLGGRGLFGVGALCEGAALALFVVTMRRA